MEKRLFGPRHPEPGMAQRPVAIGRDHLINVSGNPADQIDTGFPQKIEECFAHRATDDNSDAQFFDFAGAFENGWAFYGDRSLGDALLSA